MRITTEVRKELNAMATALPRLQNSNPDGTPMFRWAKSMGSELIAEDAKATDRMGNPIEPGVIYWRRVPRMVNHEAVLIGIYRVEGMEGCRTYCDEVNAFVEGARKRRTWYKRLWYTLLIRMGITTTYMREQAKLHQLMHPTK